MKKKTGSLPGKNLLLASVLFVYLWIPATTFAAQDKSISDLYMAYAQETYLDGNIEEALTLSNIALQFYKDNSDALYLTGLILKEKGFSVYEELDYYLQALRGEGFKTYPLLAVTLSAAELLVRLDLCKEALFFLNNLEEQEIREEKYFLLKAKALIREEDKSSAQDMLSKALRVFPESLEIRALLLELDQEYLNSYIARLINNVPGTPKDPELILKALSLIGDREKKRILLKNHEDLLSTRAEFFLEYLKTVPFVYYQDVDTFLELPGSLEKRNLLQLYNLLPSQEQKGYLFHKLATFSGDLYYDYNEDGFYQERIRFFEGKAEEIYIDSNQDDLPELELYLVGGNPKESVIRQEGTVFQIFYSEYPGVERAALYTQDFLEIYETDSSLFQLPLGNGMGTELFYKPFKWILSEKLSKDLFTRHSLSRVTYKRGSYEYPYEKWERLYNNYGKIEGDRDLRGNYRSLTLEKGGNRVWVKRDLDGNGRFEVLELIRDNKIVSIAYDEDGNGVPEYIISPGERILEIWDFNEDWIPDFIQYTSPTGTKEILEVKP